MNHTTVRPDVIAVLCLVTLGGCQTTDVPPGRLTPSRTTAVMACMLATKAPTGTTASVLETCAKEVPKIMATGLDQLTIDGALAGTTGGADPGIGRACFIGDVKRSLAAVETTGYGVVTDGVGKRVHIVQQDDVTTYHRDGTREAARLPVARNAPVDSTAGAPSACAMMIVQALTVTSLCADQQWTGKGCAALRVHMQYCSDPEGIMVDPNMGFTCLATADADAVKRAVATPRD